MASRVSADGKLLRRLNRGRILGSIRESKAISRVDLARKFRLSPSTVTKIIRQLTKEKLVVEHAVGKAGPTGGRKPTLLALNPSGGYVVGVDLDAIDISIALLNLRGDVERKTVVPTPAERDPESVLKFVGETINTLIDDFHAETGSRGRILGIGIALSGQVNHETGDVVWSVNLGWKNVTLKSIINRTCDLEVYVEDHPKSMAIGEHWFGNAKDTTNLVWIHVGGGLGIGVVMDGKIYRGVSGNPGEFCHVPIVENGPPCICGNRGCLETLAAEVGTLRRVREAIESGTETVIADMVGGKVENVTLRHIFKAANEGDRYATGARDQMAKYIALAIALAATAYDTGTIVLGGDVIAEGGDELFELIESSLRERIPKERYSDVHIRRTIMGENAGVIGAATLVYHELFSLASV